MNTTLVRLSINEYGDLLVSPHYGLLIREKIEGVLSDPRKKVIIDFSGVQSIGEAFADNCFGKLYPQFSVENIESRITYENAQDSITCSIRKAYERRGCVI